MHEQANFEVFLSDHKESEVTIMSSSAVYSLKREDTRPVDILLIADRQLVREGLAWLLNSGPIREGFQSKVEQADSCETARLKMKDGFQPSLIILDYQMAKFTGFDLLRNLIREVGQTPVVILSEEAEPTFIVGCFKEGIKGYVPKTCSPEILRHALALILAGGTYVPQEVLMTQTTDSDDGPFSHTRLTPRQSEVLRCIAKGMSNKSIAQTLNMSASTVRVHVAAVLRVLNVANRTQAAGTPLARALLQEQP